MPTATLSRAAIACPLECADCGVAWHGVDPCWLCGQPGTRPDRNKSEWLPHAMKGTPSAVPATERFVL